MPEYKLAIIFAFWMKSKSNNLIHSELTGVSIRIKLLAKTLLCSGCTGDFLLKVIDFISILLKQNQL